MDDFTDNARAASRALRRMPAELRRELSKRVRDDVVRPLTARIAAAFSGPYAAVLAAGTKPRAAGDPTFAIGGARPVVSGGASVRQLVYGDQFGGGTRVTAVPASSGRKAYQLHSTRQFRRRGSDTVYGTMRSEEQNTLDAWVGTLDPLLTEWEEGSNG